MPKNPLFLLVIALMLVFACAPDETYFKTKMTNGKWHKDSIFQFKFETSDTISEFDLFIHIRNTEDYKYSNLYLIASLEYPKGKVEVDTLEYKMAYPDGQLMGVGMGSLKHNLLWYKDKFKFTESGFYTFNLKHAMRRYNKIEPLEELDAVEEVGFSYKPHKTIDNE
jgi:gliding motility-associated lipoprotein GldH